MNHKESGIDLASALESPLLTKKNKDQLIEKLNEMDLDRLNDKIHWNSRPAWKAAYVYDYYDSQESVDAFVMHYQGLYFVTMIEHDDVGYFLTIDDAINYANNNWPNLCNPEFFNST